MLSSLLTASLAAVSQNSLAQVLPRAASLALLSDSGGVWLESTPDVVRVSQQVARRLDVCALTTSALGYQTLALQVRALSRAFVVDLSHRGVALPGLIQAAVTTTAPALVTLYRISGDARDTACFIRRNRLRHPLFVPGASAWRCSVAEVALRIDNRIFTHWLSVSITRGDGASGRDFTLGITMPGQALPDSLRAGRTLALTLDGQPVVTSHLDSVSHKMGVD